MPESVGDRSRVDDLVALLDLQPHLEGRCFSRGRKPGPAAERLKKLWCWSSGLARCPSLTGTMVGPGSQPGRTAISPGNVPRWSSPQFCSYTEAQSLDEGDDRTKGVAGVSEPQRTVRESYRDLVERVVTAKADQRFDPSTWRTDLFASDQELDDFLDDIYASRRADPAA